MFELKNIYYTQKYHHAQPMKIPNLLGSFQLAVPYAFQMQELGWVFIY